MKVEGLERLKSKISELRKKSKKENDVGVVVGYSQKYAMAVHEVPSTHKKGKQWKYLITPFRQLGSSGVLGRIVVEEVKKSGSVTAGLLLAGLRVQRDSQQIVPVDTSALKASAFTCLDTELADVYNTSRIAAETIRSTKQAERLQRKQNAAAKAERKKQMAKIAKGIKERNKKGGKGKHRKSEHTKQIDKLARGIRRRGRNK